MKQAIYKVPNGKLLKIFLNDEGGIVKEVKITGDFFMHPEEKITLLEESLKNQELNQETLQKIIQTTLEQEEIELFGADAESIAQTMIAASNS